MECIVCKAKRFALSRAARVCGWLANKTVEKCEKENIEWMPILRSSKSDVGSESASQAG